MVLSQFFAVSERSHRGNCSPSVDTDTKTVIREHSPIVADLIVSRFRDSEILGCSHLAT